MELLEYCAPCLFGVEGILGDELRRMGAQDVCPENGRVLFRGGLEMMARANIGSRYAERIQVVMGRFKAYSFEDLFQGARKAEWERFIGKMDAFPVNLCYTARKSPKEELYVYHRLSPFCFQRFLSYGQNRPFHRCQHLPVLHP